MSISHSISLKLYKLCVVHCFYNGSEVNRFYFLLPRIKLKSQIKKCINLFNYYRFAFKVVITSTAIYYTNQLEIWSELSRKERAYDQLISCAKQYIAKNTPESIKLKVSS